jgi:hypothetical protein
MTTTETVLIVIALVLIFLVVGNIVFSKLAERRNPPRGMFIDCDGVRLHYIERGDPAAPCVVLFHGNGSMLQELVISGLVDLLAQTNRVVCFDRPPKGSTSPASSSSNSSDITMAKKMTVRPAWTNCRSSMIDYVSGSPLAERRDPPRVNGLGHDAITT